MIHCRSAARFFVVCALLALWTVALYWPVRNFPFSLYDDLPNLVWNQHVRTGLSWENVQWAFTSLELDLWQPLTWLSHMVDVTAYGLAPGPQHLTNLAFHAANVVLVFALFVKMTDALWPSALLSVLFAVHPLHVESVAWIAERKDVLSTMLLLLTLAAYLRYVRRPAPRHFAPVVMLFGLGLLAKPMLVTLPCALLLLDWWPLGRTTGGLPLKQHAAARWRALFFEKAPLFALVAISSAVTIVAQHRGGALRSLDEIPVGVRLGNAVVSYGAYLVKTVWPTNLGVLYPYPQGGPPAAHIAMSAAFLILVSGAIARWRRAAPALATGWLWYLGTLVPVIGIVQVGRHALADRFSYVPHIGIFFAVIWTLAGVVRSRMQTRVQAITIAGACLGALLVLTAVSRNQIGYWKDGRTLYSRTLSVTVDEREALMQRAKAHEGHNELKAAEDLYRRALALGPEDPLALNNLGTVLSRVGRLDEAVILVKAAISANPDYAEAYYNLGALLINKGRTAEAIAPLQTALRLKPGFTEARDRLSEIGASVKSPR
jgi:predicted negative regulator of RcsB-dependent stress response